MTARYLEKITNIAGTMTYTFPLNRYEWEPSQQLRVPTSKLVGASYAYNHLGTAVALREVGKEPVRFVLHNASEASLVTSIDEVRSELLLIGLGKLYTLDQDGTRRWCYARAIEMPSMLIAYNKPLLIAMGLEFDRFTDWYGVAGAVDDTETITVSPTTYTLANPGNLPVDKLVMRLRSNSAAGFTNPKIENITTGYAYVFESARDAASADDELKLDTGEPSIKRSTNNGGAYTDDFAQLVLPTTNHPLAFQLGPGNNSIRVTIGGTPNVDVQFIFDPVFA